MKKLFHNIFIKSLISIVLLLSMGTYLFFWLAQKVEKEILEDNLDKIEMIADSKLNAIDEYYVVLSSALNGLEALILHDLTHHDMIHDYGYNIENDNKLDNSLDQFIDSNGLYDVLIIGLDGYVTYAFKKEEDLHTNILTGPYQKSAINEAYLNALNEKKVFSSFSYYAPSNKEVAFLAKTVKSNGTPLCVVVIQIDTKKIHSILNDYTLLGESGEVVTGIEKKGLIQYMNPLRFGEKAFTSQHVDPSRPIALAVKGETGSGYILDRRGVMCGAAWRHSHKLGWGLVVKMDKSELLAHWDSQKYHVMIFLGLLSMLSIVIFWYLYRLLFVPLKKLTTFATLLANGEYDSKIDSKGNDEYSILANTLNVLAQHIKENLSRLQTQNFLLQKQKRQIQDLYQNLEKEVDEKTKQLKEYIHIVDQNVITSTTNEYGIITYVSDAFCEVSGYSREELIGQNHRIIRHPDMSDTIFEDLWKTIISGKSWRGILKNRKKEGGFYWVDTVITPNFVNEKIVGYTAVRQDITAQKLNEYLVITDPMTGLFNRRYFNEIMDKEIFRSRRLQIPITFIMMDIDYFKNYNDYYGHMEGDNILLKVASVIKEHTLRAGDYSFRIGGEEFGILLTSVELDGAVLLAETIRKAIESLEIIHEKSLVSQYVTISIGLISLVPDHSTDLKRLYRLADEQLYRAKEKGRNCISYSSEN